MLRGLLLPSAAKGFVEGNEIRGQAARALHQGILGTIERPLRHKYIQEITLSCHVEPCRQVNRPEIVGNGHGEGTDPLLVFGIRHQRRFNVLQSGKDRLFIRRQVLLAEGLFEFDIPPDAAGGKYRPTHTRTIGIETAAPVRQGN